MLQDRQSDGTMGGQSGGAMDRRSAKAMFELQKLEWLSDQQPDLLGTPRRSGSFELIWIKSGSGIYSIDFETHAITGQVVYCIGVGQLHFLQMDAGVQGYRISFSPLFLSPSADTDWFFLDSGGYTYGRGARIIPADAELQTEMEEIMGKMIRELISDSLLGSEVLRGLLKILIIHLTRRFEVKRPERAVTRNGELVRRFMDLLEDNVTRKKRVSEYAGELSVTPGYLNGVIKKETGFPAHYHLQQRKVLEAKRQVMYYGISMKEIAYYLGFDDLSHFSKFFKANAGFCFQDFKKQVQARIHHY
jgi:AraC family transcriptional activator of pobA